MTANGHIKMDMFSILNYSKNMVSCFVFNQNKVQDAMFTRKKVRVHCSTVYICLQLADWFESMESFPQNLSYPVISIIMTWTPCTYSILCMVRVWTRVLSVCKHDIINDSRKDIIKDVLERDNIEEIDNILTYCYLLSKC